MSLIVSDMISHNSDHDIHTTSTKLHAIKSFATTLFIQRFDFSSCPNKGISQEKKTRRNYFAFDYENELNYERNLSDKLHLTCGRCLFNLMKASIFFNDL